MDVLPSQGTGSFPSGFVWGVATSSYQIEGAWQADGKSESIWDRFSHTPGKISDGTTGDDACEHYERWAEDIELMRRLGVQSYRFSIAWPRILPDGRGATNQPGLDFYSRLVDGLLEAGITPHATLYHWDLPQVLQDAGGWPERLIVEAFVAYADVMTRHLGDRVQMWTTINEPWVVAKLGYEFGVHAPGHQSRREAVRAGHHVLLAHGLAVPVIRANVRDAEVGIVLNLGPQTAASPCAADIAAARLADGMLNRWYLDPLAGFGYPADAAAVYGKDLDVVQPGDMATIAAPIDYLGVNYYTRGVMRAPESAAAGTCPPAVIANDEVTEMGWEVYPEGLLETLLRLHTHYQFPALYITENGAAFVDNPPVDGRVHDAQRLSYYQRHLAAVRQAIALGAPVRGYYSWSFLDNFEWAFGFTKRFGLVYVDYASQQRTIKDSGLWYGDVIAANAVQ